MSDKNVEINKDIDTSNIFDEFTENSNLIDEVEKIKMDRNRDLFYYLKKSASFIQVLFWISFFSAILLFWYIHIQNDENLKNSIILDPFCPIILGDIKNKDSLCSSVSSLKSTYENDLAIVKDNQSISILKIIEKLYEVKNFTKTKEIIFLSQKSSSKLSVLSILEEFDDMKSEFDKVDKQKIQCNSLIIDWEKETLSMVCIAYSAWFEKWLRWFDGTNSSLLMGSSVSIANSFINFIEMQSKIFKIVDRQKVFKSENNIWLKTDFTNMTRFSLKLKYNLK